MATSTIIRVKRRLEDNPQDALVLLCKRMKTDAEELSPSLFVFHGTVENKESAHILSVVPKGKVNKKPVSNIDDIIEKIRKERKDTSIEKRYEVVNCSRGLKENSDGDSNDTYDLVDLHHKADAEAAEVEADAQYAYDLYTAARDFDIAMIDNLVSIEHYETDLIIGSDQESSSTEGADDDEDSNDENNIKNDYPDEEDMIKAMENVDIEDDLSTDEGEDKIYDEPPDIFNEDVKRYGQAYAQYKAKVLAENPDLSNVPFVHSTAVKEIDEESIGYKDDSEDGFYYGMDEDTDNFKEQYQSGDSGDSDIDSPD